jgi:hypothetical protein
MTVFLLSKIIIQKKLAWFLERLAVRQHTYIPEDDSYSNDHKECDTARVCSIAGISGV